MTKQHVLMMLLLILSFSCTSTKQLTQDLMPKPVTEEDIYAKILKAYLSPIHKGEKIKSIVLNTDLKKESYGLELSYDDIGDIASASPDLLIFDENNNVWPDTLKIDLVNKFERSQNSKPVNFKAIKLPYKIELTSNQAIAEAFKDDVEKGWKKFYKKRSKSFGIVEISNLVFSADKRFCILYVGYRRRGLNGYGCLLIADLEDQDVIKAEIELWIS